MYKYRNNASSFYLFPNSTFFLRLLCWILIVSSIITLLTICYLRIPSFRNNINDNNEQNGYSDRTIALLGSRDIQPISALSSKKPENLNHVLYVISLDGKITAIDVQQKGHQLWVANTGSSLLDSTLSKIEIIRDSKSIRLIPSLIGGLYEKYDEDERMKLLPFNAESLFNTSFQFHDELVMTGGKDIDILGLDLHTGKIIYSFSKDDADQTTFDSTCSAPILIIKRIKQTVRARSARNGHEKWNFSVSNHELIHLYSPSSSEFFQQTDNRHERPVFFEYQLQTGVILAFNRKNQLLWTSSIYSPIAAVWELKNGQLKEKSLFKTKLSRRFAFMGEFNSTPYVLISSRIQHQLIHNARKNNVVGSSNNRRSVLSSWQKANHKRLLPMNSKLLENDYKSSEKVDHNYPLAVRQEDSWDIAGYLEIIDPNESIADEFLVSVCSHSTWILSSICLGALVIILIWYSKQKQIKIQHQEPILSQNSNVNFEYQLPKSSLTPSFESRYILEYEHVRYLGRGGFGVVFEAMNKLDQRRVAIKRVSLKKLSGKERALKEIRCLAVLNHPNLIQYYYAWNECPPNGWQDEEDKRLVINKNSTSTCPTSVVSSELEKCLSPIIDFTFERSLNPPQVHDDSSSSLFEHSYDTSDEELPDTDAKIISTSLIKKENSNYPATYFYFVMELCQSESLRDRLIKQTIDQFQAWTIFDQIIKGIEYIHSEKLIHRDLKPSNILFSIDNTIKIGDFGLVSAFGEDKIDNIDHAGNNELGGTVLYMSPEQMNRQSYNQKIDIYAIGIILFELLYPFSTQMERVRALTNVRLQTPIFPNDFEYNQSICCLIRQLLAYSPHDRPKACELRQDSSYQNILKDKNLPC